MTPMRGRRTRRLTSSAASHTPLITNPSRKFSSARPVQSARPAESPMPTSPMTAGAIGERVSARTSTNTTAMPSGTSTEGATSCVIVNTTRKRKPGSSDSMRPRTPPTAPHRAWAVGRSPGSTRPKPDRRAASVRAARTSGSAGSPRDGVEASLTSRRKVPTSRPEPQLPGARGEESDHVAASALFLAPQRCCGRHRRSPLRR